MKLKEYNEYWDKIHAIRIENERRIAEKFSECEKWVSDNLIDCGCVFNKHDESLRKQGFMIWIHRGNDISHKWYTLKECGIAPLDLLPYPEYK